MADPTSSRTLLDRFPSLRRLGAQRPGKKVPYVPQTSAVDCAAACLTMALRYHGKYVELEEVHRAAPAGRDGLDAYELVQAARTFGLRGRGVRCEVDDIAYLPAPAILHWDFNHYVVLERWKKDGVHIVDPAMGRRFVDREALGRSFTGVALLLEPTAEFAPTRSGSDLAWRYLKRILAHSPLLTRILFSSAIMQVFGLAMPLLTATLIDRVIPRADFHLLTVMLAGVVAMTIFQTLSGMVRSFLLLELRTTLDTQMTFDFVDHLVDLPYDFFQHRSAGDLIMRMGSNTTVRQILTSTAMSTLLDGVLVTSYLVLLFLLHAGMAALVVLLGVFRIGMFIVLRRRYRDLMTQSLQTQADLSNYQVQMLAGIETLKASGLEHRAVEKWSNLYVDLLNVSLTRGRLGIWVDAVSGLLGLASPLILLGYGGYLVMSGSMTLGTMLAMSAVAGGFLGPLGSLVATGFQLNELGSYLDRIKDVLDTPPEQDASTASRVETLGGKIVLENVSFRYQPAAPLAVRDVSVEIEPGARIAIVGASGSGKSTLAKILVGLYRPTSGRVLFDDRDLVELECRSVRRCIGYVPQQPFLFSSTIRQNIALADSSLGMDQVIEAASLAAVHEDIGAMPLGYETAVSDGGASLAAGQRQRIAIARALAQKPAIVLLDESTSALDAVTESKLVSNLDTLRATRIAIAHRLSTIVHSDLILVMEDGAIVERGSHRELIALGGKYAQLTAAQLMSRDPD